MRYIAFYLVVIALATFALTSMAGALASDLACETGTYGKVVAQEQGRC